MADPNVTKPVSFTGTDGGTVRLHADYGRLVVDGSAELEGATAADFVCEAAALVVDARKREAARLAAEAQERRETDPTAGEGN